MRLAMTMTISSFCLMLAIVFAFCATLGFRSPRRWQWIGAALLFFFLWRAFGGGNILTVYRS